MGKELEYKLHIDSPTLLTQILADEHLAAYCVGTWRETEMKTTYYDTPNRAFSARKWTFRHRREGDVDVLCVKTPLPEAHTRGEFEIEARRFDENALERLLLAGAPKELCLLLAEGEPEAICGAEFTRRSVLLRFSDGSTAELAGDNGRLLGIREVLPFTELELELKSGEPTQMLQLVRYLCRRYSLHEEPLSKFARAKRLQ